MARRAHSPALIRLFEKFAAVEGALRDEGVVVVAGEVAGAVQGGGEAADGLELGAGVGDGFFVDCEGLGVELVGDVFEVGGGGGGCEGLRRIFLGGSCVC